MTEPIPATQAEKQDSPSAPLQIPEIPSGKIFTFLIAFYSIMILIRIFLLPGPSLFSLIKSIAKPGMTPPMTSSILMDFFLYMCVACQFFPIPTIPPIAFVAKVFHPILVSAIGALGTCVANLNDYAILGWLFRHQRVKKIRDIQTYRRFLRLFDRYAFLTLAGASFLPIPVDVVRLLAISRAYTYWKYLLATFVGRFPRYLIIAYLGKELPAKYILILFLISTLPALVKIISDMIRKRTKK